MISNQKVSPAAPAGVPAFSGVLSLCVNKTRNNIESLADNPKAAPWAVDGNYFGHPEGFYEIGNWTSSFFTGMALLAWRKTEDEFFLKQVLRLAPHYHEKVFTRFLDTHHDLGFLYSLYSVALYKLTGEKEHREVGLRAAEVLSQRFNAKGNFIRAWGHMNNGEFEDMAIIDCLMNLPLLYWASGETGNKKFHDIAVKHADMALNVFVRPDDTVYHAYRFDLASGKPLRGDTFGGCETESCWARGLAWAIYGFALSYRYTKNPKYLDASLRMAKFFIRHLDSEIVPVWDFKLPADASKTRDASAASVVVCGFQELEKLQSADSKIINAKQSLLQGLCREKYVDSDPLVPGIQKFGMVGDGVPGGAKNAYTSWGDYYLMEALDRELFQNSTWW
ncbi:MAG TPA: glycoside hydrolase family 88 protein [Verrucomicrobiae bacterium]|nr:glycoside hydrolase family 88 protein [Verrucomicrobiae bacterium]